jgi:hypothetical protein
MSKKLTAYHALVMIVGSMVVLLNMATWGNLLLTIISLAVSTTAGWSVWLLQKEGKECGGSEEG